MYELDLGGEIDIAQLAKENPEKAAILIDYSIKNQVSNERESWIQRANMIYFLKANDLWQHHPENFKSFFEYCSQSEVDIAPSVASDMIALCTYAPILSDEGIDIWNVIRKSGHSKVRQIIPQIREAYRNDVIKEEVGPIIAALEGMSFREVLVLTGTSNVRSSYELEAYYTETSTGEINVEFRNLDIDDLEYLSKKAGIKRWYDDHGLRIDPPMNAMMEKTEVKAIK
jgi:hypothetical protein